MLLTQPANLQLECLMQESITDSSWVTGNFVSKHTSLITMATNVGQGKAELTIKLLYPPPKKKNIQYGMMQEFEAHLQYKLSYRQYGGPVALTCFWWRSLLLHCTAGQQSVWYS